MNDAREMSQKNNAGTSRRKTSQKNNAGTSRRAHRAGSTRLQVAAAAEGYVVVGPTHFARQALSVSLELDPSLRKWLGGCLNECRRRHTDTDAQTHPPTPSHPHLQTLSVHTAHAAAAATRLDEVTQRLGVVLS